MSACLVIFLIRFGVAMALLYYGSLFLIFTVELPELILNAVALEFVLNIDEILFLVLAPALL